MYVQLRNTYTPEQIIYTTERKYKIDCSNFAHAATVYFWNSKKCTFHKAN